MKHFFIFWLVLAIPCFTQGQTTWFGLGAGDEGAGCSHFGENAGNGSNNGTLIAYNSFFGFQTGQRHNAGFNNTFFGSVTSGWGANSGYENTFIGGFSASSVSSANNGNENTFFGLGSGSVSRQSSQNTYLGINNGITQNFAYDTDRNTLAGSYSNIQLTSMDRANNTWIGYDAGHNNNGSGNVLLGYQAGYGSTGSNQLYIENSSTNNPLIYGNFANNAMGINTRQLTDGGTAYTLSINGKMRANEVKVYTGWADYVFEKDYRLRSLRQVKRYIQRHKHLPDVPSAKEVKRKGIFVGETQATLLRKIEELTLYMLKAHNTTQQLNKEAQQLKAGVAQLQKRLAQLQPSLQK